jgi:hypothetical protein
MEATMILDILRRAKANVVVASLEDKLEIVASRKVKMIADVLLDDALKEQYDLILLPVSLMFFFCHDLVTYCSQILYLPIFFDREVWVVQKHMQNLIN